tara:strand:+ start:2507 stop:3523 length:1017 start_codon:yes stop_codon:yes gene_type:complete
VKQSHLTLLLEKYENGTCSKAELDELNAWYHSFTNDETDLEEDLHKYPDLLKTLKLELWHGIEEQIALDLTQKKETSRGRILNIPPILFRIAAVLIVGFFISLVYWKLAPVSKEFHTVSTQKDNLSKVTLPDGTIIWVKSGSNLRYPEQFGSKTREVFLDGEAFFEVAHNPEKVFLVHTSDITIKVLGTIFNVKSYKDQGTIETTLVEGSVKIEKADSSDDTDIILTPSERAVYNKKSGSLDIVKSVDVSEVKIKDIKITTSVNTLVFDETPFSKVFAQLEKRYHVKIHVEEENLNCKLTADVQKENLEEILQLLEVSHRIQYRIEGSEVYITGKLCN